MIIVDSKDLGNGETIYKDEDGTCFIGEHIDYDDGEIIVVEATNDPVEYGCHRIIEEHEHIKPKIIHK